jgi:hypothetical protein
VGPLVGFVARRATPGRIAAATGFDPTDKMPTRELGLGDVTLLQMPPEPGYLALHVVRRIERANRDAEGEWTRLGRVSSCMLSGPFNVVACRACGEDAILNLSDLEARLPADGRPVYV